MRPRPSVPIALSAAALLAAVLVTSCGVAPSTSPIAVPATTSNRFGAPEVITPHDASSFAATPCGLLTATEAESLGFSSPGRQRTSIDVQECRWSSTSLEDLVMYVDPIRDLLADTYRTQRRGYFVPTSVEGLPAVRQKSGRGEINICTVTTGLGPKQALETTWIGKGDPAPGNDACEFAEQATALVIRKLPPQR